MTKFCLSSVTMALLWMPSLLLSSGWGHGSSLTSSRLRPVAFLPPTPCGSISVRDVSSVDPVPLVQRSTVTGPRRTLFMTKKKKGGGGSSSTASKKIQVKMLKHVAGTGQAGDVVMVTPAFFNNKLRPTKSAEVISDEEVAREQAQAASLEKEVNSKATQLKEKLSELTLTIRRKAGPDGQLFGGIGPKVIIEELRKETNDEFLDRKGVKVLSLLDPDGKKMRGDIKHIGDYGASISLTKDISVKFTISVDAES